MKYCMNCGKELADGIHFCDSCGAAVDTHSLEQEYLNNTHRFLRYERLAWKIYGIVWICIVALLALATGILFIALAAAVASGSEPEILLIPMVYLIMYLIIFVPVAIANLVMPKKLDYYLKTLYTDIRPAQKRISEVGMIVYAAFFNEIALIFVIINFARAKSNRALADRIAQNQLAASAPAAEA